MNIYKNLHKVFFSIVFCFFSIHSFGQETIELKTTGFGINESKAETDALRKAIEEAFGAFISSNTEILNDELIKDEIVTISNGNVVGFELISKGKSDSETFFGTYKVTVSLTKLTEYAKSKGVSVKVFGGLFSADMKLKELYKSNEEMSLIAALEVFDSFLKKGFDFNVGVGSPGLNPYKKSDEEEYKNDLTIDVSLNKNFVQGVNYINSVIESLTLNEVEVQDYMNKNIPVYPVYLTVGDQGRKNRSSNKTYYLRSENSLKSFYKVVARIAAYPFMAIIKKSYATSSGDIIEISPSQIFNNTIMGPGGIISYDFEFIPCLNGNRYPEGCRLPYTRNGNLPHNYFSRSDMYRTSAISKSTEEETNLDFLYFIFDLENGWSVNEQLDPYLELNHPNASFENGLKYKNQIHFNFNWPISTPLISFIYTNYESSYSIGLLNEISIESFYSRP